jgi:hypothetical protein
VASLHAAVCAAPADYGELFLQYGADIKRVVRRQLGPAAKPEDVDDGVGYIVQQFIAKDVIGQYNPGHVSDYTGKTVTFKAFVMAKVALYCRGLRETLVRHYGRELLLVDAPVGDEGGMTWLDVSAGTTDEYPSLDGEMMDQLRMALAAVPGDGEPVLPAFDVLAARFAEGKSVSAAALRKEFKLSPEAAEEWFGKLKAALAGVTGFQPAAAGPAPAAPVLVPVPDLEPEPEPDLEPAAAETAAWFGELRETVFAGATFELGGLVLTAQEVRAAADALKARSGNRVLPVWQDAGHRLGEAGKTWYLAFAEQVMREHPELRTPVRRHSEGHFGRVKNALIYGLERLLDGLPAPAPEPVPGAADRALWADLQAVILRLPGYDAARAEAAVEAVWLLAAA